MKDNSYNDTNSNITALEDSNIQGEYTSLFYLDRLFFPQEIAPIIGVRKETINFWKKLGCPFVGRKTTIRWVRDFMTTIAGGTSHGIA
jgi:hypothetical protein